MARGFNDVNPGSGSRDDAKLDEIFDLFVPSKDAKGEYVTLRFLPTSILPMRKHWIQILAGKDGAKKPRAGEVNDAMRRWKNKYGKKGNKVNLDLNEYK